MLMIDFLQSSSKDYNISWIFPMFMTPLIMSYIKWILPFFIYNYLKFHKVGR